MAWTVLNSAGQIKTTNSSADTTPMTPQGRLTLTAATPVMTSDAANQTTIYYTLYVGDVIPLYNGSAWTNTTFSELSIAMAASANWAADSNFDLYVYNDSGTPRLVTGAAWTNSTTRAESLTRLNGIWTNTASMTGRYGASSTVTVAANQGTYVGTMRTTGSAGTTTWVVRPAAAANGATCLLYLWNCYNRVLVQALCRDSTDSWVYSTSTIRAKNNSASNRVSVVLGLAEDDIRASNVMGILVTTTAADETGSGSTLIGLDSTTAAADGYATPLVGTTDAIGAGNVIFAATCEYCANIGIGLHLVSALERAAVSGGATVTWLGDAADAAVAQTGLALSGMF